MRQVRQPPINASPTRWKVALRLMYRGGAEMTGRLCCPRPWPTGLPRKCQRCHKPCDGCPLRPECFDREGIEYA